MTPMGGTTAAPGARLDADPARGSAEEQGKGAETPKTMSEAARGADGGAVAAPGAVCGVPGVAGPAHRSVGKPGGTAGATSGVTSVATRGAEEVLPARGSVGKPRGTTGAMRGVPVGETMGNLEAPG